MKKRKRKRYTQKSVTETGKFAEGGEGTPTPVRATRCRPAPIYTQGIFERGGSGMKMKSITAKGSQIEKLKELAKVLAAAIDACIDPKALPAMAKQYRETIREIEEIEGVSADGDEISEILTNREADGKPGAVRKNRA